MLNDFAGTLRAPWRQQQDGSADKYFNGEGQSHGSGLGADMLERPRASRARCGSGDERTGGAGEGCDTDGDEQARRGTAVCTRAGQRRTAHPAGERTRSDGHEHEYEQPWLGMLWHRSEKGDAGHDTNLGAGG